jgi:hypothetical protein
VGVTVAQKEAASSSSFPTAPCVGCGLRVLHCIDEANAVTVVVRHITGSKKDKDIVKR